MEDDDEQTAENQCDDGYDFDQREPELQLAEDPYGELVCPV